MEELFRVLQDKIASGKAVVMVTVTASSGSSPRGAGARMLVSEDGITIGTIGGGAVEYRSEIIAREVLETKTSRFKEFNLSQNEIEDLGMVCGGAVSVYFCYLAPDECNLKLAQGIAEMFKEKEESWLITDMEGGKMYLYGAKSGYIGQQLPYDISGKMTLAATVAICENRKYYIEPLVLAGGVYIFGGGHVSQALVPALKSVDFRCVILEDREKFCDLGLFDGVEKTKLIDYSKPDFYKSVIKDDYIVIMTRGHRSDKEVLANALKTSAKYIGVIGSKKKSLAVFNQLREEGFSEEDFKRVKTPIGLDIKSETPAEIAVSITAELIMKRAESK